MLPASLGAMAGILLLVVPGFIATTVWSRSRTWRGPTGDLRTVLQSLALSFVIQILLSPVTVLWLLPVRDELDEYGGRLAMWLFLLVLALPVAGGLGTAWLSNYLSDVQSPEVRGRVRRAVARIWPAAAPPSIWDWFFTTQPPHGRFIVVEFDDGSRTAGVFAEGSLALTSPEPHGLFLVSEWMLDEDGDIVGEVPATRGVMIRDVTRIRRIQVLGE